MTSLKTPITITTPKLEEKQNDQGDTTDQVRNIKKDRKYSCKDGCSLIIFLILVFLAIVLISVCISKYYATGRRVRQLKMLNCCKRRMLINAIISNLTEEMANDLRIMFEIKDAELQQHLNFPIPKLNLNNDTNENNFTKFIYKPINSIEHIQFIETEDPKSFSEMFHPINYTFKILDELVKGVGSILTNNVSNNTENLIM